MTLPLPAPSVEPVRCRGIWPSGRRCPKWLRTPESIARGYGPDCAERHGLIPHGPAVRSEAADQQDLLDLIDEDAE
jgi:hypothetical protein